MTINYFNSAINGIASTINGMRGDYLRNQISWNFFCPAIEREVKHLDVLIHMITGKEHMSEDDYKMYARFRMLQMKLESMLKYKRVPEIKAENFCL